MRPVNVIVLCVFVWFLGGISGVFLYGSVVTLDLDDRILSFGKKIQCPDPEHVASTTFDLRTGEYTCRYFRRYLKETKR